MWNREERKGRARSYLARLGAWVRKHYPLAADGPHTPGIVADSMDRLLDELAAWVDGGGPAPLVRVQALADEAVQAWERANVAAKSTTRPTEARVDELRQAARSRGGV